jgi:RNA recognition motif-containing protein
MTSETKLFVGNISFNATPEDFTNYFKSYEGFKNAKLMVKFRSNLSRGFGFLTFDSKETADKVFNSDIVFKDQQLRFSVYVERKKQYTGYIKYIDQSLTEDDLKTALGTSPTFITLRKNKFGGQYAVITYDSFDDYKKAKESKFLLNNTEHVVLPYRKRQMNRHNNVHLHSLENMYKAGFRNGFQNALMQTRRPFRNNGNVGYTQHNNYSNQFDHQITKE